MALEDLLPTPQGYANPQQLQAAYADALARKRSDEAQAHKGPILNWTQVVAGILDSVGDEYKMQRMANTAKEAAASSTSENPLGSPSGPTTGSIPGPQASLTPSSDNPLDDHHINDPGTAPTPGPAIGSQDPNNLFGFVKQKEGYSDKAYKDGRQYSIGWGTKATSPDEVITPEAAQQRLTDEIGKAADFVERRIPNAPPGVKRAMTDLTYNAGTSWSNAGLGKALDAGDYPTAKGIFLQYNKSEGQTLPGLASRRQAASGWFDTKPEPSQAPMAFAPGGPPPMPAAPGTQTAMLTPPGAPGMAPSVPNPGAPPQVAPAGPMSPNPPQAAAAPGSPQSMINAGFADLKGAPEAAAPGMPGSEAPIMPNSVKTMPVMAGGPEGAPALPSVPAPAGPVAAAPPMAPPPAAAPVAASAPMAATSPLQAPDEFIPPFKGAREQFDQQWAAAQKMKSNPYTKDQGMQLEAELRKQATSTMTEIGGRTYFGSPYKGYEPAGVTAEPKIHERPGKFGEMIREYWNPRTGKYENAEALSAKSAQSPGAPVQPQPVAQDAAPSPVEAQPAAHAQTTAPVSEPTPAGMLVGAQSQVKPPEGYVHRLAPNGQGFLYNQNGTPVFEAKSEMEARSRVGEKRADTQREQTEQLSGVKKIIANARGLSEQPGFDRALKNANMSLDVKAGGGMLGSVGGDIATPGRYLSRILNPNDPMHGTYDEIKSTQDSLGLLVARPLMKGQGAVTEGERTMIDNAIGDLGKSTSAADYHFKLNRIERMIESMNTGAKGAVSSVAGMASRPSNNEISNAIDFKHDTLKNAEVVALADKYNVPVQHMQQYVNELSKRMDSKMFEGRPKDEGISKYIPNFFNMRKSENSSADAYAKALEKK